MPTRWIATALVLIVPAVCAGCGAADRAPDATAVARDFQAALDGRDGRLACSRLSDETASKLERDEQKPCAEAILGLDLPTDTEVARAHVYVTSAWVGAGSSVLFLDEAPAGWEISAAGCTPTRPERPLDCELED